MANFRVINSTGGVYTGHLLLIPENYTLADVSAKMAEDFSPNEFQFYAQYPYGPYMRLVSQQISIVIKKEV